MKYFLGEKPPYVLESPPSREVWIEIVYVDRFEEDDGVTSLAGGVD